MFSEGGDFMGFMEFQKKMKEFIKQAGCKYEGEFSVDTEKGRYICRTPEGLFTGNSDGNITAFFRGRVLRVK